MYGRPRKFNDYMKYNPEKREDINRATHDLNCIFNKAGKLALKYKHRKKVSQKCLASFADSDCSEMSSSLPRPI